MSADAPERDYEVGYGKAPTHTRFKRGQSGNPSGRKKRAKNVQDLLTEELNKVVQITENGKKVRATKLDIIVKQTTNAAVKGNGKPLLDLVKAFKVDVFGDKVEKDIDPLDSPDDVEARESFLRRIRGQS